MAAGDGFISTGEIVLPLTSIAANGDAIEVRAQVEYTFPLRMAEIVWGDGKETYRKEVEILDGRQFRKLDFQTNVPAPNWTWARFAVWDVAGDGAFTNPVWRRSMSSPESGRAASSKR